MPASSSNWLRAASAAGVQVSEEVAVGAIPSVIYSALVFYLIRWGGSRLAPSQL